MAWRCRFLAARPSQVGSVIAEKRLSKNYRVYPAHWLISTQVPIGDSGRCLFSERPGRPRRIELGRVAEQYLKRDTVSDSRVRFRRVGGPRAAYGDESRSLGLPREDALPTAGSLSPSPSAAAGGGGGVAVAGAVICTTAAACRAVSCC